MGNTLRYLLRGQLPVGQHAQLYMSSQATIQRLIKFLKAYFFEHFWSENHNVL